MYMYCILQQTMLIGYVIIVLSYFTVKSHESEVCYWYSISVQYHVCIGEEIHQDR